MKGETESENEKVGNITVVQSKSYEFCLWTGANNIQWGFQSLTKMYVEIPLL